MTTASARSPGELPPGELEIFLVAAEESGDRLGAALMKALRQRSAGPVRFSGVGGTEMTAAGLDSLFPVGDFSIIGFAAIPGYPNVRSMQVRHAAQPAKSPLF